LTSVEVIGPDIGAQVEAHELPLEGISADLKDKENVISISLGRESEDFVSHEVADPEHVRLLQTDDGADQALQIEAQDGTTTLVRFRTTALPGSLDGLPN